MKTVKMSIGTFAKIADNPRQRDTVRHARKAKKWLAESADTHRVVSIAELPNGDRFKLDGHTRCYLWETDAIPLPKEKLDVMVFPCETMADVKRLYTHFDNTNATENASDRLSGACREHGLELKSNLLKGHDFSQALRCVNRGKLSEYELVGMYKSHLSEIDSWLLPQKRMLIGKTSTKVHTCIKALAIALLESDVPADEVHDFIGRVVRNEGNVKAGRKDGVAWASQFWMDRQQEKSHSGWDNLNNFLGELYWCFVYRDKFRKNSPTKKALSEATAAFKEFVA